MENATRIGIVADFDENRPSHVATQNGLEQTADILASEIKIHWFPTETFEKNDGLAILEHFDGIWGAPGNPESSLGFINAIQLAREKRIPYLGT